MKPKFSPLGDTILVQYKAAEEKTAGGIYIPPSATAFGADFQGEVIEISDDCELKGKIKVGDIIVFEQRSGMVVGSEDDRLLVVKSHNVVAVRNEV